jgi:hypothetical protein
MIGSFVKESEVKSPDLARYFVLISIICKEAHEFCKTQNNFPFTSFFFLRRIIMCYCPSFPSPKFKESSLSLLELSFKLPLNFITGLFFS